MIQLFYMNERICAECVLKQIKLLKKVRIMYFCYYVHEAPKGCSHSESLLKTEIIYDKKSKMSGRNDDFEWNRCYG